MTTSIIRSPIQPHFFQHAPTSMGNPTSCVFSASSPQNSDPEFSVANCFPAHFESESPPGETCNNDFDERSRLDPNNICLFSSPQLEYVATCESDNVLSSQSDTHECSINSATDLEDSDAVCKRTRARYSLQDITLDELENFLQADDDEDDIQNVDEKQQMYTEYREYLTKAPCENVDDEDEDNDADFQIEIEEALLSDLDEINGEYEAAGRRPETRQNKHLKASVQKQKKSLVLGKKPLRSLLPLNPNATIAPLPGLDGTCSMFGVPPNYQSLTACNNFKNGFTHDQLSQLHCLIHQHVQLLIQIYSLCVLDPPKQHIALQNQEFLLEMVDKRDQVLTWRSMPHPNLCSQPQFISSSLPVDEHNNNDHVGSSRPPAGTVKAPYVSHPILSILDVAPLTLVGSYIVNVATAKDKQRKRFLEASTDTPFVKEPLFPNCNVSSTSENTENVKVHIVSATNTGPCSSSQPLRKTTATKLVERAKMQSVALVSKDIVKLAQQFLPLFDPALYPYEPPSQCAAKRVLFTESEDQLLALGLKVYNTNWKAIQQRYLPCKTENQIYIRKKNCSSANAPENAIKSVRRLKSSPLSAEEIELIRKGLEIFKYDWTSIWISLVPHRDPNQLPHQWRVANGTQKSYKKDPAKNKGRQLSSSKKLRMADALPVCQTTSEIEDNSVENDGGETYSGNDEAYVHEFFLANSKPRMRNQSNLLWSQQEHAQTHVWQDSNRNIYAHPQHYNAQNYGFLASTNPSQTQTLPDLSNNGFTVALQGANPKLSKLSIKPKSRPLTFPRRYQSRRGKRRQFVKLAPDLLPINLPKSVRVFSNSALKSYPRGSNERQLRNNEVFNGVMNPNGRGGCNPNHGTQHLQPHYSMDSGMCAPTFCFVPGNQAPLNLSLLDGSHLANSSMNHSDDKGLSPRRCMGGIEYHPLMQRTEAVIGKGELSGECVGKENGVDMEIHSSSSKEMESSWNSEHGGNEICEYNEDSRAGIVMEKEELGDSDEELGECVEFDCEEMSDSGTEKVSDCEQMMTVSIPETL